MFGEKLGKSLQAPRTPAVVAPASVARRVPGDLASFCFQPIVGMLKFAPSLTPEGQRDVTVFVLV